MPARRLLIVTGKGGVGKTTVSASLAQAAVSRGRTALVVEVAAPGRLANVLGSESLSSTPTQLKEGVFGVALADDAALETLILDLLPIRLLSRRLLGSETFRIVASAVPGIREAALLAQVTHWLEEKDWRGRPRYEVVIVDAPASGHTLPLLATPRTLAGIATFGALGDRLRRIATWLKDPISTAVLVVAIPEDWATSEATELYRALSDELEVPVGPPVLNAVLPRRFSRREVDQIAEAQSSGSIDPKLAWAGLYFAQRREAAANAGKILKRNLELAPLELPFVFAPRMEWEDLGPIAEAALPLLD